MIVDLYGIAPFVLAPAIPVCAYVMAYAVLRAIGMLRVGREGWHAGVVRVRRRIVVQALSLFTLFQWPMRIESSLRRLRRAEAEKSEPVISEVVVEVVSFA